MTTPAEREPTDAAGAERFKGPLSVRFTEPIGVDADGNVQLMRDGRLLEPMVTDEQMERAYGVLMGLVCGDALGVPYEFGRPPSGEPEMLGGGLGNYEPGEGSDDSQMALIIAAAVMNGSDLSTEEGLDDVAVRFIGWAKQGPPDIGMQTQAVLSNAAEQLTFEPGRDVTPGGAAQACRQAAWFWHAETGRSAGNGALMRTAPVALSFLLDPQAAATAARAVARLTHHDKQAGATCVLVGEAIRQAVMNDVWEPTAGLDLLAPEERDDAARWLVAALAGSPADFADEGYTVRTMQGAMAAVQLSRGLPTGEKRFRAALTAAVQSGGDTDTVAAVTGAMAAALDGHAAIEGHWRDLLHVRVVDAFGIENFRLRADGLLRMAGCVAAVFD